MSETHDVMRIVYPDWHEQPRKPRIIRFPAVRLWAVFTPGNHGMPHVQTFDVWDDALQYALAWCDEHEFEVLRAEAIPDPLPSMVAA